MRVRATGSLSGHAGEEGSVSRMRWRHLCDSNSIVMEKKRAWIERLRVALLAALVRRVVLLGQAMRFSAC
eukprot:scaffold201726_cov32-Tisochrysis_lutea.AAC.4